MATKHQVKIKIRLRPIGQPWVKINVGNQTQIKQLEMPTEFNYDFEAINSATLQVEHFNKSEFDATTAVEIVDVEFFGISDPKFVWAGIYTPQYPELWYSQQAEKPPKHLPQQNYMGWNGVWQLDFSVPVFTWMHQTLNLGWIYQ